MNDVQVIRPSAIDGAVDAPPSKSMTQRAVAACFLSDLFAAEDFATSDAPSHKQTCRILHPSLCDDAQAAFKIVMSIEKGESIIDCGEAGLSLRMFAPIIALFDKEFVLSGRGSLLKRPVGMIQEALVALGAECRTNNGFLPVDIKGPLKAGTITIDGSVTSQLLTGLLMALPCCDGDSEIIVNDLKSVPYVEMTLKLLDDFGIKITNRDFRSFKIKGNQKYKPTTYSVEGDWSGAAFLLVAGAIAGNVRVNNLSHHLSLQADKVIIDALKLCGADVKIADAHVEVSRKELKGFEFNAQDCPDLFPPLVALACYCKGKTIISGVERLKHKESDRSKALYEEFKKMGAKISISANKMEIEGSELKGGELSSHNDHRIVMASAVAGLGSTSGVQINGAGCISKSYPDFFTDLSSIIKA